MGTIRKHTIAVADSEDNDQDGNSISNCRCKALKSSYVHIIPVAATFGILQLSFRNVYWGDADAENQRAKISALQIAAKVHEILILVSLSSMILHYTHKMMLAPRGLSLGLLEAAYQSGLSSNPWTIGSWEALKHMRSRLKSKSAKTEASDGSEQRAWVLVVLVVVFAFLALFIGPASAITLIPQLGWWHREDLIGPFQPGFGGRYKSPFAVYIPANLYPLEVDESHLPGPFCDDLAKDTNGTCPAARIAEIQRSFTIPLPGYAVQNTWNTTIALSEGDSISRKMAYKQSSGGTPRSDSFSCQKAAVMVPNYLLTSFASLIRRPVYPRTAGIFGFEGPFTLEVFANDAVPLAPLVGVNCNDSTSNNFVREYSYNLDGSPYLDRPNTNPSDITRTDTFDIRSVWDQDELKNALNGTELIWRDMTTKTETPVLLGLLRHDQNVTVCTVQSYWTSASQWVLSTSSYDVATNFTFDASELERKRDPKWVVSSMYGYPYSRNTHRIHIHEKWANTLNAVNGSVKVLDAVLLYGITTIKEASQRRTSNSTLASADLNRYLAATISQLLAKTVANGLAHIGAQYAADRFNETLSVNEITVCNDKTRWCSAGPWVASTLMPLATVANASRIDVAVSMPIPWVSTDDKTLLLHSFPKPIDQAKSWTRISIPVRRYGYAYSFDGITTYFSVALLCLHAAMVVIHVTYRVLIDRKTFVFGGSLGSLLVLAMGDKALGAGNMWAKHVTLVPSADVTGPRKFKLEVIEPDCRSERKIEQPKSEEEMKLVNTGLYDVRTPRHPSSRTRGIR